MTTVVETFTAEQVEAFHRDGFLIVEEGLISEPALERLRSRYERLFEGDYETGIAPDEVNWKPGRDPEDRTRQLCNAWKSDTVIAAQVLSARIGRLAAQLMGYDGVRILQDNVLWKPPGAKAVGFHQDGSYADYLVPPGDGDVLDDACTTTAADAGPIAYVRGSNHWGVSPPARTAFHAPEDWLAGAREAAPEGAGARGRTRGREGRRRRVPPQRDVARLGAEPQLDRGAHGPRLAHAAGPGTLPRDERRPELLALPAPRRPRRWTSRSSR